MASLHVVDFLNRSRWVVNDAIRVFAEFAPILSELQDNPLIIIGLDDDSTFATPHDDINKTITLAALQTMGEIFASLTPTQKQALYAFRATKNVPGR